MLDYQKKMNEKSINMEGKATLEIKYENKNS